MVSATRVDKFGKAKQTMVVTAVQTRGGCNYNKHVKVATPHNEMVNNYSIYSNLITLIERVELALLNYVTLEERERIIS